MSVHEKFPPSSGGPLPKETWSLGESLKRYAQISTSTMGILSRLLGEEYLGLSLSKESHAEALKTTLGHLKGPVMKIAQLLSTIPGALPEEYTQTLMSLQNTAPPMGWLFVRRRMVQELGSDWASRFRSFEREACAAASLGQVHRAISLEGVPLACKLQYPHMEATVDQDIKTLKVVLSVYETFSRALKTQNLFDEIQERLKEELDYQREAQTIALYHRVLAGKNMVSLPTVFPSLSTQRLLTMTWLEGHPLRLFKDHPLEERNQIAQNLFHLWYFPLYRGGLLHGDPHLGNYTIRADLGINLLDFGCSRLFSGVFIQGVVDLYRALLHKDRERAVHAYETWGFTALTHEIIEALTLWAQFLYDPLLEDKPRLIHAHHGDVYGRDRVAHVHAALHRAGGIAPPREFVLMDRAAVGMGAAFMHLGAVLNWHRMYEELIADFSPQNIGAP